MTRPIYEKQSDRIAEARIAEFYREWSGYEFLKKQPMEFGPDFKMFDERGRLQCLIEVKDRSGDWLKTNGLTFGFRDGYYMAEHKVETAMRRAVELDVSCDIVVRFRGWDVYRIAVQNYAGRVYAGRKDRNDRADMEWEKVYPWDRFEKIGRLVD
jgi:hypothetical protein